MVETLFMNSKVHLGENDEPMVTEDDEGTTIGVSLWVKFQDQEPTFLTQQFKIERNKFAELEHGAKVTRRVSTWMWIASLGGATLFGTAAASNAAEHGDPSTTSTAVGLAVTSLVIGVPVAVITGRVAAKKEAEVERRKR
jgi:hypothetical protein